jgi:hypothetical protein
LSPPVGSGNVIETQDQIAGRLFYTFLQLPAGADEVSRWSWQLMTAIHDEGDGLTLSDSQVMTTLVVLLPSKCCHGIFSAIS